MNPTRCASCGGTQLTPPRAAEASTYSLHLQYGVNDGSWLGGSVRVRVQGVVCVDCGYVSFFAAPEALEELRSKWTQLR